MRGYLINPFDGSKIPMGISSFHDFMFPEMTEAFKKIRNNYEKNILVDVKENETSYDVFAELPGCNKENISVELEEDVLTISASYENKKEESRENYLCKERCSGKFSRSIVLPNTTKEGITAKYVDGVLHIVVPKHIKTEKESNKIVIE